MSVLETPRIYFRGEVTWDPITTNNYNTNYDEDAGETIYPMVAERVKAFRAQAIAQVGTGNWNPHGTHRATFFNSVICGFDTGSGVSTRDPFVNAAISLKGMLVDLEPYGAFSSQIFFDQMCFGVDGGYRILAPRTSRITARYINFARNTANAMIAGVASAVWQTSFAKTDGLRVDVFDSAALKGLATALNADDVLGLTVRFNTYRTIYYDNPDLTNRSPATTAAAKELIAKLNGGGFQPNPARSLMVGVIGLWRKGEPAHEPGDRTLTQVAQSPASAHVRVNAEALAIDLSNSIPEVGKNLTKQDLGTLSIVAVDPNTQAATTVGSIGYRQYDRVAYEATAGIVTITLAAGTASTLAGKDIEVRDASGNQLLGELPWRCIPSAPNLYLDEGDQAHATYQVYKRGVPAAASVSLDLYQMDAAGDQPTNVVHTQTDANGILTVPITAGAGSITAYVPSFGASDQPINGGINPQVNTYMYVRVRPSDTAVAQLPASWENIYVKVLANWNAMAPCMDNWLMLDDPEQIKAYGAMLKRLTNPANFESYLFMPVTRDMSAGERTLLYKFLDSEPARTLLKLEAAPAHSFARLSRSMRRLS